MLILLIDDERMVRITVRSMIEQLYPGQHTIVEAKNGTEALALLQAKPPDLAYVDYKIPVKNGAQVICEAQQSCPFTRWILLSGYERDTYAHELDALPIADFLLKPASVDDIRRTLNPHP